MAPTRPRRGPVVPSQTTCIRRTLGYGADQRPRVRSRPRSRRRAPTWSQRRDESLGQFDVWSTKLRVERIRRHEQRPGEALGGLLVVVGAPSLARVDGVAVEAQRGDEAAFVVVRFEDLDVRGVVDTLCGQRGATTAVQDQAHVRRSRCRREFAPGASRSSWSQAAQPPWLVSTRCWESRRCLTCSRRPITSSAAPGSSGRAARDPCR